MKLTTITSAAARLRTCGIVLTILTAMLVVSCHSGRTASGSGSDYEQTSAKALSRSQLKDLLGKLEGSYGMWDDVKVPVTLRLKSPKKFSIGGTLSMKRGENIHLSLRFLGMEVAALMVTQDSIFALYKLEKLYFAESISDMLGGFPATVSNVQDLLLGRAFMLGTSRLGASDCRLSGDSRSWTIEPSHSPKDMSYDFTVDTPTGNIEKLTVNLPSRKPITADYSDFTVSAIGPMAATTLITASGAKTTLCGELNLNARRAEWGSGAVRNWTVPKGYTRVKAADIMKIVSGRF